MKLLIKVFLFVVIILTILFLWREIPELSTSKKVNGEKISWYFSAIGSMLTALTVFLLFNQIKEQIEDRKSASRPDLFPENQFFMLARDGQFPNLKREGKEDTLIGLISVHNIGLAAAKEISITWHFKKDLLLPLIDGKMQEFYSSRETTKNYSFVSSNGKIEVQLPLMYLASITAFKSGWSEMIWEALFLEIAYKDIHDFKYTGKIFKADVYVGAMYVSINFSRTDFVKLSQDSSMQSTILLSPKD